MARNGHRHRLVLYTRILNHWWKFTLSIGILLLILAVCMGALPIHLPAYLTIAVSEMTAWVVAGAGGYALLLSLFLIAIRNLAYVQPSTTRLRVVLPFIQFNISYRRIRHTTCVEIQHLFQIGKDKGWKQRILLPMAGQTAVVLEMQGWPLPRWVLQQFLSPFFFVDKNSRLVLLVPKWMEFSTELESFRSTWHESQHQTGQTPQAAILASLSKSKK